MNVIKKKKDADEQQRLQEALEEFRETFEDGSSKLVPKTFIRSDIVNADKSVPITPTLYKPTAPTNSVNNSGATPFSVEIMRKKAKEAADKIMQEVTRQTTVASSPNAGLPFLARSTKPDPKKPAQSTKMSNLEIFKEELKQLQEMRQERKGLRQQLKEKFGPDSEAIDRIAPPLDNPYIGNAGSEFDDDPTTTNLYVCNLPLDVQMEDLYETFGSFGPLASAKILYPRPDDERRRDHLCGFIAYMSRTDAARAWYALSGERMKDAELRVSWARPVAIPPIPFYVPIPLRELAMPDPPSGLPFNAKPLSADLRNFLRKFQNLPRLSVPLPDNPELVNAYKQMISNSIVRVVIPTERPLLALIHRVIEFLVREGPVFEAILMARERANPMYRFLFENHHPTHVYYRWKLYSILQGEDKARWRLERFKMFEEGSWWEPPPHSLFDNGMPPQLYGTAYVSKRRGPPRSLLHDMGSRKRTHNSHSVNSDEDSEEEEENGLNKRGTRRHSPSDGDERRHGSSSKKWRGVLNDVERQELEEILRNILPDKTSIGDAMIWCIEHADCAKEIVQCIYESLCIKQTPLHKKIARIYLCSDILANCGARLRDVFYFRQYFGDMLVKIFVVLNETLEAIQSRIKAEQFRQRIMLCFRMWEDNSIYSTDVLINMQNIFLGLSKPPEEDPDDLDGEPIADDIDGVPLDADDIDGVPLDDTARSNYDSNVLADTPMPSVSAMSATKKKQTAIDNDSLFKTSSWSQVNPADEHSAGGGGFSSKWDNLEDAPTETVEITPMDEGTPNLSGGIFHQSPSHNYNDDSDESNVDKRRNGSPQESSSAVLSSSKEYEEERRKLLRDVEVKVVKLQDELESDRQCQDVDVQLTKYRKKLTDKMEEKLAKLISKRSSSNKSKKDKGDKSPKSSKKKERESSVDGGRNNNDNYDRGDRRRDSRERVDRERDISTRERNRSRSRERTSNRYERVHTRDRDDRRRVRSPERRRR